MVRRAAWSFSVIVAPEIVAYNAWLQYCTAKALMASVNHKRGLGSPKRRRPLPKRLAENIRGLCNQLGRLFSRTAGQARMILFHRSDQSARKVEQRQSQNESLLSRLDNDQLPWKIGTAFYARYGGAILVSDYGMANALSSGSIRWLANDKSRSRCLLPLQRAVLQDPSKASGLAKLITCTQALWFCAECIARLCNNMAVSLLELNTFAHCISAFFIYVFWWHKPYDVLTHAHVNSIELYQDYLFCEAIKGLAVRKRGRSRWRNPKLEDRFPLTINTQNPDGSLTPLGSMETMLLNKMHPDHRMRIEAIVPSTGLIFSTPRRAEAHTILLTNEALAYLKKLWLVRLACENNEQSPLLGVLESWSHPVCWARVKNLDPFLLLSLNASSDRRSTLIMVLVVLAYGGIHLLAWQYHFHTRVESIMWRSASLMTAASGIAVPVAQALWPVGDFLETRNSFCLVIFAFLYAILLICGFAVIVVARSFLVIESFRALPNSPVSVYDIPRWTSYLPHF
jgi:hypothetical protein